jgi:3-phenylpropionate/cinnamic acid dioxygenase small subunit
METPLQEAAELLYREAACLDECRWDDWLAMFTEDCEFWIPAWKGEHELTSDPTREVSLVYYNRRARLEERVSRIRSGLSAASTPLPRTLHLVSNVRLGERRQQELAVLANWHVHSYRFQTTDTLYGRYEYGLVQHEGQWRIRRKKIVLVNDVINTVLDINQV